MTDDNQVLQKTAKKTLKEALLLIPNFLKLLYRLIQDEAVTAADKALLAATAVYVLSPLDFLPDMVPFLGQVDDILLIALVLKRLLDSVNDEVLIQYWDGDQELLDLIEKVLDFAVYFVPPGIYQRLQKKAKTDEYIEYEDVK